MFFILTSSFMQEHVNVTAKTKQDSTSHSFPTFGGCAHRTRRDRRNSLTTVSAAL